MVDVEPTERLAHRFLGQLPSAIRGGGKKLAVGDFAVVVRVQASEELPRLPAAHAQFLSQALLQFLETDRPTVVLVQRYKLRPQAVLILQRHRPRCQRQARAPERRGLWEANQGEEDRGVNRRRAGSVAAQPGMLKRLRRAWSPSSVHAQERAHEVPCTAWQPRVVVNRVKAINSPRLLMWLPQADRELSGQEDVRDDADRKQVGLFSVRVLEDLWCTIAAGPNHVVHVLTIIENRETEINELQVLRVAALEEDVLWLQVTMHHAMAMHVCDSEQHLPDDVRGPAFRKPPTLDDAVVELATRQVLHDEVQLALRLVDTI
mmetsp:Transcript_39047/g.107578  ORF Transcript_39047/g.107578 Transcript_39047/m.107578 type:complete len:319 (+) Transcript_39047:275-1231(+)